MRGTSWLAQAGRELLSAIAAVGIAAKKRWPWLLGLAVLIMWIVSLLMPQEKAWLSSVRTMSCEQHVLLRDSAEWLSWLGNFWGFNAPLAAVLLWLSWRKQSVSLRRLAVISLVGAALAGSVALVGRGLSGRPRPTAQRPDGFYGPHKSSQMQAFPSGHTASAFGCALPLLGAAPQVGIPATLIATGIGWSRLYLNRHHPTDVLVSVLVSALVAVPLVRWQRKTKGCH